MSGSYFLYGSILEKCGHFWADMPGLGKYCTGGYGQIGVACPMSPLRCCHVTCRFLEIPHVTSLIFIFASLGSMSFLVFLVCFNSFFVFCIADLPHSPGVVYHHLLLRRETRIPRVALFSFWIGIWDLFVHRGQKSYTPTAFGKLWTPGVSCMKHASS